MFILYDMNLLLLMFADDVVSFAHTPRAV